MSTTQEGRLLSLTTPLAQDFLLIKRIRAAEGISQLFRYELEMLHEETEVGSAATLVDPQQLLGQKMTVSVRQDDGAERFFNGICVDFTQGNRNESFSKYKAELVPQLWLLTQKTQSRIFQNMSVPEILQKVIEGFEYDDEIQGTFEPRNYCVQYRESDWDFASRLMEEEGIYYYFEHTAESHRLIIGNTPGSHRPCPTRPEIPFAEDISVDQEEWTGRVTSWRVANKVRAGKFTLRDYNFQLPTNSLEAVQMSRFNIGGNQEVEVYDHPGEYAKRFDGIDAGGGEQPSFLQKVFDDRTRTVGIRQEEIDVAYKSSPGASDCCAMTAGYRFQLTTHPVAANNRNHVLVSVRTEAVQTPSYLSDDTVMNPYSVSFASIPQGEGQAPFRPLRRTAKPIVHGSQTATVTGPAGEEIFVDKFGRVKVQFHWDREGRNDATSSCWLRVSTSIAGNKWGTMFIPRVGQEVIVDFIEGDPDQPIITGSVYNPETMPHYDLPKYKTMTYIKTRTSPDDGKGFNELRFEDKANKEQVFIRSQKRYDLRARGSMYETCGGNRQEVIGVRSDNEPGGNLAITVGGNKDLHIKADNFIGVDGKLNEGINGDVVEGYDGNQQTVVSNKVEINAKEITLEALNSVTLKVGASFIKVDLVGVTIEGPLVKINSGGMAPPTGPAIIDDPLDAATADTGEPGYLDRPRTGGGGGRRRRTLNGQHAPNITHQAFNLTRAAGTADDMDRALVAAELSKIPPHALQRMEDNGSTVAVCRNSVTEVRQDLAGVQPRGWPAGTSWDTVPGLNDPGNNQVIIATRGHGTEEGPHVPRSGDGHGSSNLVIHEAMHNVDSHGPNGQHMSESDQAFIDARNNDPAIMGDGYEGTANAAGHEEAYAESAARFYGGDPNDAANHPGMHDYWENDPLNPNPAPAGP